MEEETKTRERRRKLWKLLLFHSILKCCPKNQLKNCLYICVRHLIMTKSNFKLFSQGMCPAQIDKLWC